MKPKFKAWHTSQKRMISAEEMAHDHLTLLTTGKFINVSSVHKSLSEIYDTMIPIQFTGLHDADGNEIYLSDIVQATSLNKFEVIWHEDTMSIKIRDIITGDIFNFNVGLYRVVGNIHSFNNT